MAAASPPVPLYGTVEHTERLSASMVRVVLGGEGLAHFQPTPFSDQYINARFLPDGSPFDIPFDLDDVSAAPPEHRPRARRFTVRSWDPARGRLTLDFVVHGDAGYAGRWAQRARSGDRLQFTGPNGGYQPDPDADWHLLVGDESALPAIGASLDLIPAGVTCHVLVVVDGPDDEIDFTTDCNPYLTWLHRSRSERPDQLLLEAVTALEFPPGRVHAFVHGEAGEVRAVRRHLLADRGVDPATSSISPYWRRDHTDEAWRKIKKAWQEDVAGDV